jgi:excinuclease ABC subunit A
LEVEPNSNTPTRDEGWIVVKGARTHNLQDIDVNIPRGRFVVISGVSGSGKSSLAFDTLYAEGQRRYVESLSSYARQFLGQMKKPDCDSIEGLSPAISIDQKQGSHNPRSTVATTTEIQDYLRLLYARVGQPHCPECGDEVARRTVQEIVDDAVWRLEEHAVAVWSPVVRNRKGTHLDLFRQLAEQGYLHGNVNGREVEFEQPPELEKNLRHDVDVRVDRMRLGKSAKQRLTEAVEAGLLLGGGTVALESLEGPKDDADLQEGSLSRQTEVGGTIAYSEEFACPIHGAFMPEMTPRVFSFNNPLGACPSCQGLGVHRAFSPSLVMNEQRSVEQGCVRPFQSSMMAGWYRSQMRQVCDDYGIPTDEPFNSLEDDARDILLHGSGSTEIRFVFKSQKGSTYQMVKPWEGVFNRLKRMYQDTQSDRTRNRLQAFMTDERCPDCDGEKLNPAVSAVTVGGVSLPKLSSCSVLEALAVVQTWRIGSPLSETWDKVGRKPPDGPVISSATALVGRDLFIAREVLKEIESRLRFLALVGLDYLTLERRSNTLSGGESQRIRLATQIGTRLTGVTYVLDEPSIGLHARDNARLLSTLRELCELGNTLLVVEHDEATLRQADWLVDLGPGAGKKGGKLLVSGPLDELLANEESVTGAYLSGRREIPLPSERVKPNGEWLTVHGASLNNLKSIDVRFPLGCMVAVTGVSGSGKSSLVSDILAPVLLRDLHGSDTKPGAHDRVSGADDIDKVIVIDQSPIGRTPRSNAATYTGAFDGIRTLFSETSLARERGYKPGHFSFNVRGGRCEACKGAGAVKMEMHFLADVWVTCDICSGSRYTRETLEVTWKGRTIHDILEMSAAEGAVFFASHQKIHRILQTMVDVGLGYIRLGQPATTLSGGEAQRVKLATQLHRPANRHTVYLLDEPTTGLALSDIQQLIEVLHRIRSNGHTVIIIEHHMDVIKSADWVVDLGPEGGEGGGEIVAEGTPEEISNHPTSHTGQHLQTVI